MNKLTTIMAISAATLIGAQAIAQTTAPSTSTTPSTTTIPSTPMADPIYTSPTGAMQWRSSDVIGKPIYSRTDERVGEIEDLLLAGDGRIVAAVVGVGGFLGMGEHKVAIAFPAMEMKRDASGKPHITVAVSKEMLKAAPEYKSVKAM